MENLYLLIPFFIIFLFFVPLKTKIRVTYNPLKNLGTFVPYLLGLKLGHSYFSFRGRGLYVVSKKSRKEFVLAYTGTEVIFYNHLNAQIINKSYLRTIEFYANVGAGRAMESAMLSGLVESVVCTLFGMIKNKKSESFMIVECHTSFNENVFQLAFCAEFSISFFDVVYSLLMSVILTRRTRGSQ